LAPTRHFAPESDTFDAHFNGLEALADALVAD